MGSHILYVSSHLKDKIHGVIIWNSPIIIRIFLVHGRKAKIYTIGMIHGIFWPLLALSIILSPILLNARFAF